jgi:uncharacterized membrane protein YeaQ/YmgE (transglycosylase-associated protein family)
MMVTGIITALVVGLIIGVLAHLVLPGKHNIPIWLTIVMDVIGAILGTVIAQYPGVAVTPASIGSRSRYRLPSPQSASPSSPGCTDVDT